MTRIKATKKDALEFIDEVFWSKGYNPKITDRKDGELIVELSGKLWIKIKYGQGRGCFKVPVGHETKAKYEWQCTD